MGIPHGAADAGPKLQPQGGCLPVHRAARALQQGCQLTYVLLKVWVSISLAALQLVSPGPCQLLEARHCDAW